MAVSGVAGPKKSLRGLSGPQAFQYQEVEVKGATHASSKPPAPGAPLIRAFANEWVNEPCPTVRLRFTGLSARFRSVKLVGFIETPVLPTPTHRKLRDVWGTLCAEWTTSYYVRWPLSRASSRHFQ